MNEKFPGSTERREPFKLSPMPPLNLSEALGLHTMQLLEGTNDIYVDAAPVPGASRKPVLTTDKETVEPKQ